MQKIGSPQVGGQVSAKRKMFGSKARMAAGVLAFGATAFASGGVLFSQGSALARSELMQSAAATTPMLPNSPRLVPGNQQFSFADLVERVSPAVVSVQVDVERGMQPSARPDIPAPFREFFRRFDGPMGPNGRNFRAPQTFRTQASGSGFIVDNSGYIVTNNHVVESARKITVKLSDGRELDAKLIGSDKDTDVALLKVEASNLPTVALGDDRRLRVGDWVVAVGNPFGLGGTVTAGIVSSIGRDIGNGPYTDYIQIDAPINRGNSGGPTFDIGGRVVGMNTAIYSPSGGSVGIGFAVPASTIQNVVDQLKTTGSVDRGWLGVQIQDFTPELASSMNLKEAKGAIVAEVVEGSPAERAGFVQGDVVVAVNGTDVADSKVLTRQVAALKAGQSANFTVLRDGVRRTLTATIERRDPERLAASDETPSAQPSSLGMSLMPINPAVRQQYELDNEMSGVLVASVDPDGEAARKGLRAGDVIKRVGSKPVQLPSDVARGIDEAKRMGRETVAVLVANNDGERFVALRIAQG
jgi:serine protease Do